MPSAVKCSGASMWVPVCSTTDQRLMLSFSLAKVSIGSIVNHLSPPKVGKPSNSGWVRSCTSENECCAGVAACAGAAMVRAP